MNWNLFTLSNLILIITSLILTFIFALYGKSKAHRIWSAYNLSVGLWGLGGFFAGSTLNPESSLFWWRLAHVGVVSIPIFLCHATILFCDKKYTTLIKLIYLQGLIFLLLIPTKEFFTGTEFIFNEFYYPILGPVYHYFFLLWLLIVSFAQFELFKLFQSTTGIKKLQILYLFAGLILGLLGGITNFLPGYNSKIYPYGNFAIPIYSIIVTYAILKYRLLDLSIAITRTGIFVAVYSLVLGVPFAMAFGWQDELLKIFHHNWWSIPLLTSTVLATAGPFIYVYLQKRAEDRLLQEQRRYQMTLRQASSGMGRIKDLKKLLNMIVHIVTRTVRLEHGMIYIYDPVSKKYILGADRQKPGELNVNGSIDPSSALISYFKTFREPLVYEELKQRNQDYGDKSLADLEKNLKDLDAALVVPTYAENQLLGILILGRKKSGKLYSRDDLDVFTILANQAALAIENAQFYENMKKTHEQLFQAEKMATIGTMADGLSHQINNRLHALGFIAGDALDTIKSRPQADLTPQMRDFILEIENALKKIQQNVVQGGEIVEGLLRYTRKGEEGFCAVDLDSLLKASLEMAQFKIKLDQLLIVKDYAPDIGPIKGNFVQLQEVFFNVIDNAYDAMMQRKSELCEPGFSPTLRINAIRLDGHMEVEFSDNGMGVKKEDMEKVFTPFFTTKLSSRKGTGLGLYVVKKIIEENHGGKVVFVSEYMKGTRIIIRLPRFL